MRYGKAYFKRVISTILAASLIFSVTPVSAMDGAGEPEVTAANVSITGEETIPAGSETELVTEPLDFINDENDFSLFSADDSAIQLSKVSETDSSITISWSSAYGETFSHYEVYCNGVVQTGITDTTYTVTGLAGGNEYGISVHAYDIEGNIIGMSDTEYFYTNWTVSGDNVLTSDKIVSNLYINSGTLNFDGHTLMIKGNV